MSTVSQRLMKSTGASGLSLVARVSEQLLLVPILLAAWTPERYGEWMMLVALPTFFALSDMGFISAGSNELARRASQGDEEGLQRFYGRFITLCLTWYGGFFVLLCLLVLAFSPASVLGLKAISAPEASTAFLIMSTGGLVGQCGLGLLAGLRARGLFHIGLLLRSASAILRLGLVLALVLFADIGPVGVATVSALGYLTVFAIEWMMLRPRGLRPLWWELRQSREPMRPYMLMGLEFMLMPLASIMMLQGVVLLVGSTMGALAVAVFTTHRTLARIVSSMLQIVVNPLTAEAGLLQKKEDLPDLRRLMLMVSRLTLWVSLSTILVLMVLGPWIFTTWTQGAVLFDPLLFFFLLLATLGETVWRTLSAAHLGSNRHRPIAWAYLGFSLGGLGFARLAVPALGLAGIGAVTASVDILMTLFVAVLALPALGISGQDWLKAICRPPLVEIAALLRRRIGGGRK